MIPAEALRARFPHFDPERAAPLFHPVQPADGTKRLRGQGDFPCVLMVNGCAWFYDRGRRPVRENGQPMKSQAPSGVRPLLLDDSTATQLVLTEGEGHAVALRSIGWRGVVVCGGVQGLRSSRPEAAAIRRQVFEGRDVWILFDSDAAGRQAVAAAALKVLEAGATRVSVVTDRPESWPEGADVEDWLATFETPERAYAAVLTLLGGAQWQTRQQIENPEGGGAEEPDDAQITEHRIVEGGVERAFLVTVYDEVAGRCQLAVYGPPPTVSGERRPTAFESVQHDAEERHWQVGDTWTWEGVTFRPTVNAGQSEMLRTRQLVLPGPPVEYGTSEGLWTDTRSYIQRWLILADDRDYDTLVAFSFLSWRVWDVPGFENCPYVRFYGAPGTGKSHALQILRLIAWRAFSGQTTPANLHRFMEYYKSVTLIFDEFHLEGRSKERRAEVIDTLNFGSARSSSMIRCDRDRNGNMIPNLYRLFGPKMFAGYGHDEHEGLARRTVAINMGLANPPDARINLTLPVEVYTEAYQLRRRLLAWRMAKSQVPLANPDPRAQELIRRVGRNVAQNFYPLVVMVPAGLPQALENLYQAAEGRRIESREARNVTAEAALIDGLAQVVARGLAHQRENGDYFVTTAALQGQLADHRMTPQEIAEVLKQQGITACRTRPTGTRGENPVRGYVLGVADERLQTTFRHFGVEWPPSPTAAPRHP